jgi:hypothetical protein
MRITGAQIAGQSPLLCVRVHARLGGRRVRLLGSRRGLDQPLSVAFLQFYVVRDQSLWIMVKARGYAMTCLPDLVNNRITVGLFHHHLRVALAVSLTRAQTTQAAHSRAGYGQTCSR